MNSEGLVHQVTQLLASKLVIMRKILKAEKKAKLFVVS